MNPCMVRVQLTYAQHSNPPENNSMLLKEMENMLSMFLSSYRNTRESLGELKKAVETPA